MVFIFNQKIFKDLKAEMDIELGNIVYYKDDIHYFVMTAKKDSLLRKGVLLKVTSGSCKLYNILCNYLIRRVVYVVVPNCRHCRVH